MIKYTSFIYAQYIYIYNINISLINHGLFCLPHQTNQNDKMIVIGLDCNWIGLDWIGWLGVGGLLLYLCHF
jgi:hypothetical protein